MIEKLKDIMATKKKTSEASDNVIGLEGAQYVENIEPASIQAMRDKYQADRDTLWERMQVDQRQLNAFEGAIAACDQILNAHTKADKVEIDG